MLDPNPVTRITIACIKASDWFKHDYAPSNYDDEDDASSIQEDVRMCCISSFLFPLMNLNQVHCLTQSLVFLKFSWLRYLKKRRSLIRQQSSTRFSWSECLRFSTSQVYLRKRYRYILVLVYSVVSRLFYAHNKRVCFTLFTDSEGIREADKIHVK